MCHRMEHVTYLEGENDMIAREQKEVRHVAHRVTKKSLCLEKQVLTRRGTELCRNCCKL